MLRSLVECLAAAPRPSRCTISCTIAVPYKLYVIVDPNFGERLATLPEGVPVWIVDTPKVLVLLSDCGQGWQFPREPSKCKAEYQKRLVSGFLYTFGVRKRQQNSHFVAAWVLVSAGS